MPFCREKIMHVHAGLKRIRKADLYDRHNEKHDVRHGKDPRRCVTRIAIDLIKLFKNKESAQKEKDGEDENNGIKHTFRSFSARFFGIFFLVFVNRHAGLFFGFFPIVPFHRKTSFRYKCKSRRKQNSRGFSRFLYLS